MNIRGFTQSENDVEVMSGEVMAQGPVADLGNACAGIAPDDLEKMREAATILAAERGLAFRLGNFVGNQTEGFVNAAGRFLMNNTAFSARKLVEMSLARLYDASTRGMDHAALAEEVGASAAGRRHKLVSTLSGAATGFMGAPGMVVDIPLTTGLMLRSIAGIARSYGEDPATEEGRRACLEVFALSEQRDGSDGQAGYWAARAALSRLAVDGFVRRVATILGVSFSQKLMARTIPVAGAVAGGSLNYAFMDYYQQMARVHFTLRQAERRYDPEQVRACMDRLTEQARASQRRRPRRTAGEPLRLPPIPSEVS
ncbi:MAG: EcsC family protein [Proteobacteria bacterium]|nr:EcsC family protein [Pseudomonadota bacterium]